MAKKKSSRAWAQRHIQDPYVKMAQQKGYRARAAFKLTEILDAEKLLRRGDIVVDLGSAPGSWSQVARERLLAAGGVLDGRVIALDLLPMEPVAGVEFIQGDFREDGVLAQLHERLQGQPVDLVISDMAPNLSGIAVSDQARAMHLAELALEFALAHLKPGGNFLVKVFQGAGFDAFRKAMAAAFAKVLARKPEASRGRSKEVYLLGLGLRPRQRPE